MKDKDGKWEDLTVKVVNNKHHDDDDDDERDDDDDDDAQRLLMKTCKKMYQLSKRLSWWAGSCLKECIYSCLQKKMK